MFKEIETTKYTTYTSKRPNNYKDKPLRSWITCFLKNQAGIRSLPVGGGLVGL